MILIISMIKLVIFSNTDRQRGDNILDLGIALLYSLINYCFTKESEHKNL